MTEIRWELYPLVTSNQVARTWLQIQEHLQLAPKTIDAYAVRSVLPLPCTLVMRTDRAMHNASGVCGSTWSRSRFTSSSRRSLVESKTYTIARSRQGRPWACLLALSFCHYPLSR